MNLDYIREQWQGNRKNKLSTIALWDSVADDYLKKAEPSWSDNFALSKVKEYDMISKDSIVLDVGCGVGRYSFPLARKSDNVIGIDISSKMIDNAIIKAKEREVNNIEFEVVDWHQLDLEQKGWKNKFDLVFCHMSPAIQSLGTFEKLIDATKGWCVYCKPTRRTDSISDIIREKCGVAKKKSNFDEEFIYAFETLWIKGYFPKVDYQERIWDNKRNIIEAQDYYLNRIKESNEITSDQEDLIKEYIQSIAYNGIVKEHIVTTVAMLYWHI